MKRFLMVLMILAVAGNCWAGWLDGWTKRQSLTVAGVATSQTNYAVKLTAHFGAGEDTVTDIYCNSAVKTDFSDLRFTAADGTTLLSHWIETKTDSDNAVVWIKIPSIPASPDTVDIVIYYGNAAASSTSNINTTFLLAEDFEAVKGQVLDNTSALDIPCYYSTPSNQPVHPSVLYFPSGWHGHTYWMAFTPYPNSVSSYENPSIVVSADKTTWSVPTGLTNPVVPKSPTGYNSDTELVYNDTTDELWMYFKATEDSSATWKLYAIKSADGIAWTDLDGGAITNVHLGTVVLDVGAAEEVSPAVRKISADSWVMWTVTQAGAPRVIKKYTSTDGRSWGTGTNATVTHLGGITTSFSPWHIQVKYLVSKSKYLMMANNSATVPGSLFLLESTDGAAWTLYPVPLLDPSTAGWDNGLIYRATFLLDASDVVNVWYSGRATATVWGTAYTEIGYDALIAAATTPIPGWTVDYNPVMTLRVKRDTTNVVQGVASAVVTGKGTLNRSFGTNNHVRAALNIYDTNSTSLQMLLQVTNAANTSRDAVGVSTGNSAGYIVYSGQSSDWVVTEVPRALGYKKVEAAANVNAFTFYSDGTSLGTKTGQFSDATRVRLTKDLNNATYLDALTVRPYVSPEPAISGIGAEETAVSSPKHNTRRFGPLRSGFRF